MRGDEGIAPYEGVCQQNDKLQIRYFIHSFLSQ